MNDIISLLEAGREDLLRASLNDTSSAVREYLAKELKQLPRTLGFMDALPGALFNRNNVDEGIEHVLGRIQSVVELLSKA